MVPCAGTPSLPTSGAVSSQKWPFLCLEYLTQPAQGPSCPRLAWATSHTVQHLRSLDSAKVPHARAPSLPASGAVSRWKWLKLSLEDLIPPAKRPSSPGLARAGPHTVRHLHALDSAKVPRVPATSLPASGAVSRRKRLKLSLSNLTPPAERPSSPRLAQAYPHAVLHLLALDSPKVPRVQAPSLQASGAVSRQKWPY